MVHGLRIVPGELGITAALHGAAALVHREGLINQVHFGPGEGGRVLAAPTDVRGKLAAK